MDRLYRFEHQGTARYAVERDGAWRLVEGDVFGSWTPGAEIAPVTRPLAPVLPSKIVAVGLNYKDHAAEQHKALPEEPMIFIKPSTAVIGPGDPIRLPPGVGRVDHEAELGVVIGRTAFRVPAERAGDYVLGLTCVNDVTARALQAKDVQFTRAKGFDSFAPIGPAIALGLDARALDVEGWVNGTRRQASNTRELIFPVDRLVAFVSFVMTLHPGDIISTGTPAGVGPLAAGDQVMVKVQGVGELANPVVARET
jgi:2-keto-4-pentenoate hydratase/2-oxohepta-3-ene-1,7-dioic acid hydratase in catechol pathway